MRKGILTKSLFAILTALATMVLMFGEAAAEMTPRTLGYGNLTAAVLSPDGRKLATGSKPGTIRLWDCASGEVVKTLTTNFTVTALSFSPDGSTLFSGSTRDTLPNFFLWNLNTGVRRPLDSVHVINDSSFADYETTNERRRSWAVFWNAPSDTIPVLRRLKGSLLVFSQDGNKVLAQSSYIPMRLSDIRLGFISSFSTGAVNAAAFCPDDPDGMKILVATTKNACLWDVRNNEVARTFGDSGNVRSIAASSDGSKCITSFGSKAIVWNAGNGAAIRSISTRSAIATVAFSPNDAYILTTSDDNTVRLWDVTTGTLFQEFTGHTPSPLSVAFSPDGSKLVAGAEAPDNTMRLWDVTTGRIINQLYGHTNAITSVAYSPDGANILTGSLDSTAQLWDAASGASIASFRGHTGGISSVAFSPDGKEILTGSRDGSVGLWSVDSMSLIRKVAKDSGTITAIAISPDGANIAAGRSSGYDYRARVWNVTSGNIIMSTPALSSHVLSVAFSSNGTKLLTAPGRSGKNVAAIWDIGSGDTVWQPVLGSSSTESRYAVFSPDNKFVLTGGVTQNLLLWDAIDQTIIKTVISTPFGVNSLAFSQDGAIISAGASDGIVRLWNIGDTSSVKRPVNGTVVSADFRFFAAEENTLVFLVPPKPGLLPNSMLQIYTPRGVLVGNYSGMPGSKRGTMSFHATRVPGRGAYICRLGKDRMGAKPQTCIMLLVK